MTIAEQAMRQVIKVSHPLLQLNRKIPLRQPSTEFIRVLWMYNAISARFLSLEFSGQKSVYFSEVFKKYWPFWICLYRMLENI